MAPNQGSGWAPHTGRIPALRRGCFLWLRTYLGSGRAPLPEYGTILRDRPQPIRNVAAGCESLFCCPAGERQCPE